MSSGAKDIDAMKITQSVVKLTPMKTRLDDGIFHSDRLNVIDSAFEAHLKSSFIAKEIKKAIRSKKLPKKPIHLLLDDALKQNIISQDDYNTLKEAIALKDDVVQVDGFDVKDYLNRK